MDFNNGERCLSQSYPHVLTFVFPLLTPMSTMLSSSLLPFDRMIDAPGLVAGTGAWENIQEVIRSAFREVCTRLAIQEQQLTRISRQGCGGPDGGSPSKHALDKLSHSMRDRDMLLTSLSHDTAAMGVEFHEFKQDIYARLSQRTVTPPPVPLVCSKCDALTEELSVMKQSVQRLEAEHRSSKETLLSLHSDGPLRKSSHDPDTLAAIQSSLQQLQVVVTSKADLHAVTEAMSLKANKATVSTALHTKANKTDVDAKFASVDAQLRLLSQQMQEQVSVTPPMPPPPTIVPESKAIEPPQPHVHSLITTVSSTLDVLRSDLRDTQAQLQRLDKSVRSMELSAVSRDDLSASQCGYVTKGEVETLVSSRLQHSMSLLQSPPPPQPIVYQTPLSPIPMTHRDDVSTITAELQRDVKALSRETREGLEQCNAQYTQLKRSVDSVQDNTIPTMRSDLQGCIDAVSAHKRQLMTVQDSIATLESTLRRQDRTPLPMDTPQVDVEPLRRSLYSLQSDYRSLSDAVAALESKVREGNLSTLATHTRMESHLRELDDGLRQANDQCATINTECKRRWEKAQHSHDRSKTSVATTIEDVANLKLKLMQMEASMSHLHDTVQSNLATVQSSLDTVIAQHQLRTHALARSHQHHHYNVIPYPPPHPDVSVVDRHTPPLSDAIPSLLKPGVQVPVVRSPEGPSGNVDSMATNKKLSDSSLLKKDVRVHWSPSTITSQTSVEDSADQSVDNMKQHQQPQHQPPQPKRTDAQTSTTDLPRDKPLSDSHNVFTATTVTGGDGDDEVVVSPPRIQLPIKLPITQPLPAPSTNTVSLTRPLTTTTTTVTTTGPLTGVHKRVTTLVSNRTQSQSPQLGCRHVMTGGDWVRSHCSSCYRGPTITLANEAEIRRSVRESIDSQVRKRVTKQ